MKQESVAVKDEEATGTFLVESGEGCQSAVSLDSSIFRQLNMSMSSLSLASPVGSADQLGPVCTEIPPINRLVLKELDYSKIEGNVQIMHDLYLEPTLRIQPNRKTRCEAVDNLYWLAVQQDINNLIESVRVGQKGRCPDRLKILLAELVAIVEEIHPESATVKETLQSGFDLDLIYSGLECGQLDFEAFGNGFADLLQANCAPKRDALIIGLRKLAIRGEIVDYLRDALSLLEIMKIDLVNYRLSNLRKNLGPMLVKLERDFWSGRRADLKDTTQWLAFTARQIGTQSVYHIFSQSLVNLTLGIDDERMDSLPEVLLLDEGRLRRLRADAQDLCLVALILGVQKQFLGKLADGAELKAKLFTLLQEECIESVDICQVLVANIESAKGRRIPSSQVRVMESMLDKLADPEFPAYKIMEERLAKHMLGCLQKRSATPQGFEDLKAELDQFTGAFGAMAQVNWVVHEETYTKILQQLQL